ncbi:hypothetical protein [Chitinophaga sp. MM2321]|uniref:hypothetical protein n=1 Tax=Chitinophaga sp. MM2321 TaxID=3137178 RepID=UPI0032D58CBC
MEKRNQATQPDPKGRPTTSKREETGEFQQTESDNTFQGTENIDEEDQEELEYDEELDENSEAEEDEDNP